MRAFAAGIAAALMVAGASFAGAFSPGTLVVYRVGDGTTNLVSSGSPVFLDEYTTNGALVQSIAMPTNAAGRNYPLIASGTATSEGLLARSVNNRCLVVTGYGTTTGVASLSGTTAASVPRVVGVVNCNGTTDTTTALKDFASASNPRSAATTDGTNIWVAGGAGGLRYTTKGATNSTSLNSFANLRQVAAFGGQLYASTQSGSNLLNTVGAGLPTNAGQAISALPGFPTNSSPDAFLMADLTADGTNDTLYVADEGAGLQKFTCIAGSWTATGVVGSGTDSYRGLAGYTAGSATVLFATRKGGSGSNGGGELVTITDNSGFNGAFGGTPTVLATAVSKTAFRGVALAPVAPLAPPAAPNRMILSIR